MTERKGHIKLTPAEVSELETLTLTKKIARSAKGALTAKQLAEVLNISPKTVFKLAKAGVFRASASVRRSGSMPGLSSIGCGSRDAEADREQAQTGIDSLNKSHRTPSRLRRRYGLLKPDVPR